MTRRARLESELGPLLARLVGARGSERDRILLEAAMSRAGCAAAELWRLEERGWRPLLGIGDHDRIPPADRVRAVLEERLTEDVLPPGEWVLRVPDFPWALALGALAVGDVREPSAADVLEALLLVRAALDTPSADEPEAPPLPAPRTPAGDAPEG